MYVSQEKPHLAKPLVARDPAPPGVLPIVTGDVVVHDDCRTASPSQRQQENKIFDSIKPRVHQYRKVKSDDKHLICRVQKVIGDRTDLAQRRIQWGALKAGDAGEDSHIECLDEHGCRHAKKEIVADVTDDVSVFEEGVEEHGVCNDAQQ